MKPAGRPLELVPPAPAVRVAAPELDTPAAVEALERWWLKVLARRRHSGGR